MAGTFIVNGKPGRCTIVSQARVTSVGTCQTTCRSTKLESLADEMRPAGLFLHCSCTTHEIVRQSFGATERHVTLLIMMTLTRRGTSSWTIEFCSCRSRGCVRSKSKTPKDGESHRYKVPCTLHCTRLAYTPTNGTSGFSSSQFSMPDDELAPSRGVRCLVSLLVGVVTRPVLRS